MNKHDGIRSAMAAVAACGALASTAGAQPYEMFFESLEGIVNIDGTPTSSTTPGFSTIGGFATVDAKTGTVAFLDTDTDEFSSGLILGAGLLDVDPLLKGDNIEVPLIGKSRVTDKYSEFYDSGFNFLDGSETYTEKIAFGGKTTVQGTKVGVKMKYGNRFFGTYGNSKGFNDVVETESGSLQIAVGTEHKGKASVSRNYADLAYGLFLMDEPVAEPKFGVFAGPALYETQYPNEIFKGGGTLTGGTCSVTIKPNGPTGSLGTYKSTASLGSRRYRDAGVVDIDAATLGGVSNPEDVYDGFDFAFSVSATTPASQEVYKYKVQR